MTQSPVGKQFHAYRIGKELGAGGFARVYRAYDSQNQRWVALKLINPNLLWRNADRERFRREVRVARTIRHQHIVPVYKAGFWNDDGFIAMRVMEGGSLSDLLARVPGGQLPLAQAAQIVRQLAAALDYAHKAGIVHRDVKPSNTLLDRSGNAYLADFGIAHVRGMLSVTNSIDIIGTVAFMSPEHVRGLKYTVPASDIFALGVILYYIVTGSLPFGNGPGTMQAIQQSVPKHPCRLRPDLPKAAGAAIMQALAKEPQRRPTSASALAGAFAASLGNHSPARRADQPARRRASVQTPPVVWWLVLLVGLLVVLMMIAVRI